MYQNRRLWKQMLSAPLFLDNDGLMAPFRLVVRETDAEAREYFEHLFNGEELTLGLPKEYYEPAAKMDTFRASLPGSNNPFMRQYRHVKEHGAHAVSANATKAILMLIEKVGLPGLEEEFNAIAANMPFEDLKLLTVKDRYDKNAWAPEIPILQAALNEVGVANGWDAVMDMLKGCAGPNGDPSRGSHRLAHRIMQELSTVVATTKCSLVLHGRQTKGNKARGSPGGKPGFNIHSYPLPEDQAANPDQPQNAPNDKPVNDNAENDEKDDTFNLGSSTEEEEQEMEMEYLKQMHQDHAKINSEEEDGEYAIRPEDMIDESRPQVQKSPAGGALRPGTAENHLLLGKAIANWKKWASLLKRYDARLHHLYAAVWPMWRMVKKLLLPARLQLLREAGEAYAKSAQSYISAAATTIQRWGRRFLAKQQVKRAHSLLTLTMGDEDAHSTDCLQKMWPDHEVNPQTIGWARRMLPRSLKHSKLPPSWADSTACTALSVEQVVVRVWTHADPTDADQELRQKFPGLSTETRLACIKRAEAEVEKQIKALKTKVDGTKRAMQEQQTHGVRMKNKSKQGKTTRYRKAKASEIETSTKRYDKAKEKYDDATKQQQEGIKLMTETFAEKATSGPGILPKHLLVLVQPDHSAIPDTRVVDDLTLAHDTEAQHNTAMYIDVLLDKKAEHYAGLSWNGDATDELLQILPVRGNGDCLPAAIARVLAAAPKARKQLASNSGFGTADHMLDETAGPDAWERLGQVDYDSTGSPTSNEGLVDKANLAIRQWMVWCALRHPLATTDSRRREVNEDVFNCFYQLRDNIAMQFQELLVHALIMANTSKQRIAEEFRPAAATVGIIQPLAVETKPTVQGKLLRVCEIADVICKRHTYMTADSSNDAKIPSPSATSELEALSPGNLSNDRPSPSLSDSPASQLGTLSPIPSSLSSGRPSPSLSDSPASPQEGRSPTPSSQNSDSHPTPQQKNSLVDLTLNLTPSDLVTTPEAAQVTGSEDADTRRSHDQLDDSLSSEASRMQTEDVDSEMEQPTPTHRSHSQDNGAEERPWKLKLTPDPGSGKLTLSLTKGSEDPASEAATSQDAVTARRPGPEPRRLSYEVDEDTEQRIAAYPSEKRITELAAAQNAKATAIEVRYVSELEGEAAYAAADIPAGHLGLYYGLPAHGQSVEKGEYTLEYWNGGYDIYIDATHVPGWTRKVQDKQKRPGSPGPNCEFNSDWRNEDGSIPFFPAVEATRPIQRGEKLTVDYGKAFKRAWLKNSGDADSGSGTDGEDGWIGGRDEAQAADLSGIIASEPDEVLYATQEGRPSTTSQSPDPAEGPVEQHDRQTTLNDYPSTQKSAKKLTALEGQGDDAAVGHDGAGHNLVQVPIDKYVVKSRTGRVTAPEVDENCAAAGMPTPQSQHTRTPEQSTDSDQPTQFAATAPEVDENRAAAGMPTPQSQHTRAPEQSTDSDQPTQFVLDPDISSTLRRRLAHMANWSQQLAIITEELATTACANGQEVQTQAADRALALLETMDDMRDQPSFSTMVSRNMARRAQAIEVCQALMTSIDGLQNNQALYEMARAEIATANRPPSWSRLDETQQEAAALLGWDSSQWNIGVIPQPWSAHQSTYRDWMQLSAAVRHLFSCLGVGTLGVAGKEMGARTMDLGALCGATDAQLPNTGASSALDDNTPNKRPVITPGRRDRVEEARRRKRPSDTEGTGLLQ